VRELDLDLLARLCATPGVSGREDAVRALVRAELRDLVDEISVDAMGNLIATRRGDGGPRVMVAAHMDEIGLQVKAVREDGLLETERLGGLLASPLPAVDRCHPGQHVDASGELLVDQAPAERQPALDVRHGDQHHQRPGHFAAPWVRKAS